MRNLLQRIAVLVALALAAWQPIASAQPPRQIAPRLYAHEGGWGFTYGSPADLRSFYAADAILAQEARAFGMTYLSHHGPSFFAARAVRASGVPVGNVIFQHSCGGLFWRADGYRTSRMFPNTMVIGTLPGYSTSATAGQGHVFLKYYRWSVSSIIGQVGSELTLGAFSRFWAWFETPVDPVKATGVFYNGRLIRRGPDLAAEFGKGVVFLTPTGNVHGNRPYPANAKLGGAPEWWLQGARGEQWQPKGVLLGRIPFMPSIGNLLTAGLLAEKASRSPREAAQFAAEGVAWSAGARVAIAGLARAGLTGAAAGARFAIPVVGEVFMAAEAARLILNGAMGTEASWGDIWRAYSGELDRTVAEAGLVAPAADQGAYID